jgi:hypothetical protein
LRELHLLQARPTSELVSRSVEMDEPRPIAERDRIGTLR